MNHTIILLLAVLLGTLVLLGATVISYKRKGEKFILNEHLLFFGLSFVVIGTVMVFSNQIAVLAAIGFFMSLGGGWALLQIIKVTKVDQLRYPAGAQGFVGNIGKHGVSIAKAITLFLCSFGSVILLWASETPAFEKHQYLVVTIAVLMIVAFLYFIWKWSRPKR